MREKYTQNFRPWLGNLIWVVYGFAALWLSWHFLYERGHEQEFMATGAVISLLTLWQWSVFSRRFYGQRVETRALKDLAKAVNSVKDCKLETSVPLKAGGDADAVVIFPTRRFNIEIKSMSEARQVTARHSNQSIAAARELFSTPVIWLPKAKSLHFGEKNQVVVVGSDAKQFLRYLAKVQ